MYRRMPGISPGILYVKRVPDTYLAYIRVFFTDNLHRRDFLT